MEDRSVAVTNEVGMKDGEGKRQKAKRRAKAEGRRGSDHAVERKEDGLRPDPPSAGLLFLFF